MCRAAKYLPLVLFCLVILGFGCDIYQPEPVPWEFFARFSVTNNTGSSITIKTYGLSAYDADLINALVWGADEGYEENLQFVTSATIPPGETKSMSTGAECYSHSTANRIGRASFLLKLNGDKLYAGWDISKYGNTVVSQDGSIAALNFSGSGYGYIVGENKDSAGQWYSTLPPKTKTLKDHKITAAYTVTITAAGASFDSVTLTE